MSGTLRPTIADVVAHHAGRDFGATGFRELALDVFNDGEQVLAYRIFHVWRVQEGVCESVYVLSEPSVLAGTAVKLVESPFAERMNIWLRLSTMTRPIRVDVSRRNQFVLGTDFTYEDLRFWLPTDALEFHSLQMPQADSRVLALGARRVTEHSATELRVSFDTAGWLPLSIEWLDPADGQCLRIYSATDLFCVDRIWTARLISVSRPRERYRSIMTLCHVLHGVQVDQEVFRTENLSRLPASMFESLKVGAKRCDAVRSECNHD
jgi:hypothetical protein